MTSKASETGTLVNNATASNDTKMSSFSSLIFLSSEISWLVLRILSESSVMHDKIFEMNLERLYVGELIDDTTGRRGESTLCIFGSP